MTTSNNSGDKNKYTWMKVISIILYVIATIILIVGVVSIIEYAMFIVTGNADNMHFNGFFDDEFFMEFEGDIMSPDIAGMASGIKFIVIAVILFAVATILMTVYRKRTRDLSPKQSDENLFDSVKQSITVSIKSVADKVSKTMSESLGETDNKEEKKPKQKIFCAYCGSELDENDKKCPSCGASKKFRKN